MLDSVLAGSKASGALTKRVDLADLDISPCDSCRECDTIGKCTHIADDMASIYKMIREIDALVIASPIYFMGVSAQLKAVIDRCQCFWVERYVLKNRPYEAGPHPKGLFVATAGSTKKSTFEPAIHCAKAFFAALDYEYAGEILMGDTDSPGILEKREPILKKAISAGEDLVR